MLVHAPLRSGVRVRVFQLILSALSCLALLPLPAEAQYMSTELVSNASGAIQTDTHLVNGWGLTSFATSPFWVSDQNTSNSTLYKGDGTIVPW
jgi:hypothetical protein